jgi:tetratricopeptide (TPR) repeat protein
MSKDFTLDKYEEFLKMALNKGYVLVSFQDYLANDFNKALVLRHDVDKKPQNSLRTAELQHRLGVKGTYYFRAVPSSFDVEIIKKIVELGHEIGYHYEDLTICNGDYEKAIVHFEKWLKKLRDFYPVKTVCMHGSPLSKHDNRKLWDKYDYKSYDLIAEPYFDIDFNKVFYITDTGRKWDGHKVSVRDKVSSKFDLSFHTTDQLIDALKNENLPNHIMQNIHPQRWSNNSLEWIQELVLQRVKNGIKKTLFVK